MFVLGFDFGIKYIGIAVGQKITKTSNPLTSVFIKDDFYFKEIIYYIDYWSPVDVIIGYPFVYNNYDNSKFIIELEKFIENVFNNIVVPIHIVNENLSTWESKKIIFNKSFHKRYFVSVNALSAAILIEQWFLKNLI